MSTQRMIDFYYGWNCTKKKIKHTHLEKQAFLMRITNTFFTLKMDIKCWKIKLIEQHFVFVDA